MTPLPHDDYSPSPEGPVGGRTRWGKAMHCILFRRSTAPYQISSSSTSSQPTPTHIQITNTPPAQLSSSAPLRPTSTSTLKHLLPSSQISSTNAQVFDTPPAPAPLVASSQPACTLSPRPRHRRRGRPPARKDAPYHIPALSVSK